MALEQLVDCFNAKIGSTAIARGGSFDRRITQEDIVVASDAVDGDYSIDDGPVDIACSLDAQDPLIVPTVLALSFPLAVEATGRLKTTTTYRKHGVAHGLLTGVDMTITDKAPGSCRFDFRNRAVSASNTIDDEAPTAAGSAPTLVSRATTIRIVSGSFTPAGGSAIPILGLSQVTWRAQAMLNQEVVTPGSGFIDAVDVCGWRLSGGLTVSDTALATLLSALQNLGNQIRGTLAVVCRVSGQAEAASPPANQTLTWICAKLKNPSESLKSKSDAAGNLVFNQILRDGATLKTLAQMLTAA